MNQTEARRVARDLRERGVDAIATTADAQAGKWETTEVWLVKGNTIGTVYNLDEALTLLEEEDPCPRCGGEHDRIDRREPCPTT